jgi:S1-C subfamily serine protease
MSAHDELNPRYKIAGAILTAVLFLLLFMAGSDSGGSESASIAQKSVAIVETSRGWGSAVAFKVRGSDRVFFLTAKHVVENKTDFQIKVLGHTRGFKAGMMSVPARLVVVSAGCDAAILTIPPVPWDFLGAQIETQLPLVGTDVLAVGNMHGPNFDGSVSQGIVAQVGVHPPEYPTFPWDIVDQTTAVNLPGSSGGPVFRKSTGRLLGIQVGNIEGAAFFYLPSRILLAHAHAEGWDWLFGRGKVPSETELTKMADGIIVKPEPEVLSIQQILGSGAVIKVPAPAPPPAHKGLDPALKRGHR